VLDLDFHVTTGDITTVVCVGLTKVLKRFSWRDAQVFAPQQDVGETTKGDGVRRCRRLERMAEGGLAAVTVAVAAAVVVLGPGRGD
jgi:hypothetical protein